MKHHKIESCPACGSRNFTFYLESKDYALSHEDFIIEECLSCGLLVTNPRPNEKDMGRYYKSAAYISHTNQSSGLFGKVYQFLRRQNIRRKQKTISSYSTPGFLVDYGCGTGEFLFNSKQAGWKVKGVEISTEVREAAIKKYQIEVLPPSKSQEIGFKESVDVVTMWHVLEHLSNVKDTLLDLISLIKQGGYMFVAVPNPESWDAKHYDKFWAAWDLPIHLSHFKKKAIISLFKECGMELVEIKKMPLDSFYISLLSEEYKTGKKRWIKATINGAVSNLKSLKTTNTSSLTYIFKKPKA